MSGQSQDRLTVESAAVLVGLDLLGDGLYKLPFIRALRAAWPTTRITWISTVGPTAYAGALREVAAPYIDEVIEQAPLGKGLADMLGPLRFRRAFDMVIDTRGHWKEALVARRLPHKCFIASAARFALSDRRPPRRPRPAHIVDRLLEMAELATGRRAVPGGAIEIGPRWRDGALQALPPGPTYVGFAPGAGNPVKNWPLDRFAALAGRQAVRGRRPAFLLGPEEAGWRETIAAAVPAALFPLQEPLWGGTAPVAATIAVAGRLACAVANDSGTGHMIAAADCPLVSLFGPTRPEKLAPRASRVEIVDAGGPDMAVIPVDAAERAMERLLAG